MATSDKLNSPARVGTRSGRAKPPGVIAEKIPEQTETLAIADNSLLVEHAYEKQRRLRIESNHARMAVMSCFCSTCFSHIDLNTVLYREGSHSPESYPGPSSGAYHIPPCCRNWAY